MKICGIILNYFGHEDTISCVQTLVNQSRLEKIIIVENSANSTELRVLNNVFENNRRVEIITPAKNLGFSGGVNLAVRSVLDSCLDAYLILNNDTLVPPNTIKHLAKGLLENDFDMISPIIYNHPEKHKIWAKGQYYNRYSGLIFHRNIPFLPGNIFYLSGCCILIHRRVFEKVGLLDTSFFMYGEDVEFCFRVIHSGFRFGIADKTHIYHKGNVSSQFNSLFYEQQMNKGHFLLCRKLSKNKTERRFSFVIKVFSLAIRAIFRSLKYKNTNAIYGYKQALLGLPKT